MTTYRHTPEMGEISGFGDHGDPQGRKYEEMCQDMLEAGVKWVMAHPDVDLSIRHSPQITGYFESNTPETKALEDAILAASYDPETDRKEATGAMMHNVIMRVIYIAAQGWDKYVEQVMEPDHDDAVDAAQAAPDNDEPEPPKAA